MDFAILGPVQAHEGERPIELAGRKQQLLLALLLADAGSRVSRDVLTEALWPDRAPGDAAHALDVQISRLRRAIGQGRILTENGGYRLELEGASLDASGFRALLEHAARLPPPAAAERLREALALWRGAPFGDLRGEAALREASQTLDELRVEALEQRFEAELALGNEATILHGLEALVAEQPLRERPTEQLMVALYRCGRQADALRVYDDMRRRLSEELGIDPGESARRLHEAIVRQDPALGRTWRSVSPSAPRRVWRIAAGMALLVAVAALVVVLAGRGSGEHRGTAGGVTRVPVGSDRLAFVDLRSGRILASYPIGTYIGGEGGATLVRGRGSDWLTGGSGVLLQLDPGQHRIRRLISLGFPPAWVAVGLGSVWVVAADRPLLVRLNPVYGTVQRRYRLPSSGVKRPGALTGVAVAAGSVWVAQGGQRVLRVDPRSGRTLARISAPGANALADAGDAVWVSGGDSGNVYRIDTLANAVVARAHLDPYVCCVAVGGGYVWAMNYRVWKLSTDGTVLSSIPFDGDGANISWTGGDVWAADGVSGRYTVIRPLDDATRIIRTGGLTQWAIVHGDIATLMTGEGLPNLLAGIRGPVARIELATDYLQPDDPALPSPAAVPSWREQLLDATCARLLALRSAPPPLGWTVASAVSTLPSSPDGRVWTFRIRPGFRFSPPSGARVTAASMRYTIERALSPEMGGSTPGPSVLGDLEGLASFRSGRTPHIRGLAVRGDRLIIRLRAPAHDLPLRMTSRAFCAVPDGTPAGPTRFEQTPIPSAGPYYLARHLGGNAALLRRNPNFHGPYGDRFAAFLYEMPVRLPAGVDRVAGKRADLVSSQGDPLRTGSAAARRFGTRAAQGANWSRVPLPATDLLALNIRGGPLTDVRLRRAVALALDRRAMAALFDDQPTADLLPPGVSGSLPVALPRPDPQRARVLVGHRRVTLTFGGCAARPACQDLGSLVGAALGRAGIAVRFRPAARHADLTFRRANMATPDPLAFLAVAGGPSPPSPRPALAQVAALARRLDAQLTRDAEALAFGTPTVGELASARLGCRTRLPLSFGDDLTTLCPTSTRH